MLVFFDDELTTFRNKNYRFICNVTVVGDNIITMKTTFDLNFDLYEAVKQLVKNKNRSQEKLTTCKLVIRKKLMNNKNLNKKVIFIVKKSLSLYNRLLLYYK